MRKQNLDKVWTNYINLIKCSPVRYVVQCFSKYYVLDRDTMQQVGKSFDTYEETKAMADQLNS